MNVLVRLYVLQLKGKIRNIFSKPSSAIFAILIILFYGGFTIRSLLTVSQASIPSIDVHSTIMLSIGFSAMMVVAIILQKKMSLLFENDAFFLFTGPFKRSQIMHYIMSQTFISCLLMSAINTILVIMWGGEGTFTISFFIVAFVAQTFLYLIFFIMQYYVYLVSMDNPKLKKITRYILFAILAFTLLLFLIVLGKHDFQMKQGAMAFLEDDLFYFVPVFGWVKMVLVSYLQQQYGMLLLGSILLVVTGSIVFYIMSSYKGEFVEHAMQDAEEFTAVYKDVKAGKRDTLGDKKVKDAHVKYRSGAGAIFSKSMLLMKKTNSFIRKQDVIGIGIYIGITIISGLDFSGFCMMLIFWLFFTVQSNEFANELKNYQIYLIPDAAWKKLIYLILPSFLKTVIVTSLAMIIVALMKQPEIIVFIQFYVMIIGYALLFICTCILSSKILKSRTNKVMESFLIMIITMICSLPSICILVWMMSAQDISIFLLIMLVLSNLIMNFLVSGIILFVCRNMLDGHEFIAD